MKKQIGIVVLTLLLGLGVTAGKAKAADVGSNESWDQASSIAIGGNGSSSFSGKVNEAHYFKFTAPADGNPWIQITMNNQSNGPIYMDLLDSSGNSLQSCDFIGKQDNISFFVKVQDTGITVNGNGKTMNAGNVYGIRVKTGYFAGDVAQGNVSVYVKSITDDVWGTAEKAAALTNNKKQTGTLEVSNDVDYYAITLPADGKQYQFCVTADNGSIKARLEDEKGISKKDITVTSKTQIMEETGSGQKVYVRIEPDGIREDADISEINRTYSINVTEKKADSTTSQNNTKNNANQNNAQNNTQSNANQNNTQSTTGDSAKQTKAPGWFPKITCKKGAKLITGKLSERCTLNVKVGGKTYIRSTSMTGKFQIKLKKQLRAGTKIKVKVWSGKHGTKSKTFRIK